jgi:hypothetical protein
MERTKATCRKMVGVTDNGDSLNDGLKCRMNTNEVENAKGVDKATNLILPRKRFSKI